MLGRARDALARENPIAALALLGSAAYAGTTQRNWEDQGRHDLAPPTFAVARELVNRGFAIAVAIKMGERIVQGVGDDPCFSKFVPWYYLSALGVTLDGLRRRGLSFDRLAKEIDIEVHDTRTALELKRLFSGTYAGLSNSENALPRSNVGIRRLLQRLFARSGTSPSFAEANFKEIALPSEKSDLTLRIETVRELSARIVALIPMGEKPSIHELQTNPSPKWQPSGLLGVDRLKLENELLKCGMEYEKYYRELINELSGHLASVPQEPLKVALRLMDLLYASQQPFRVGNTTLLNDALRQRTLDCDTSAVIVADVLSARGLPYKLVLAPYHVFVDVEGFILETSQGIARSRQEALCEYGNQMFTGESTMLSALVTCLSVKEFISADPSLQRAAAPIAAKALAFARSISPTEPFLLLAAASSEYHRIRVGEEALDFAQIEVLEKQIRAAIQLYPSSVLLREALGILDHLMVPGAEDRLLAPKSRDTRTEKTALTRSALDLEFVPPFAVPANLFAGRNAKMINGKCDTPSTAAARLADARYLINNNVTLSLQAKDQAELRRRALSRASFVASRSRDEERNFKDPIM